MGIKTPEELRKFGWVLGSAFGLIGGLTYWRGSRVVAPILLVVAGVLLLGGLLFPRLLGPIERLWMALAEKLGAVMTVVILGLTFYLVITPVGFLLRLMGKDLLKIRETVEHPSYWTPLDQDEASARIKEPY